MSMSNTEKRVKHIRRKTRRKFSSEVLKDWGELEVTFNSCGAALALLTGTDGEKTSNLEKLAGIDQSTCP